MQPLPMNELAKAIEAAGFKVKFEVMDWNTLLATFWAGWEKNPNVDAINVSLSVLDPVSGFLKHFTTANRGPVGLNWGWYQNKELDELADKVQASFDPAEQKKILQHMHEMVVADGGRVFIVHDLNPRALSPTQGVRSGSELVPGHDADRGVRDDELSRRRGRTFLSVGSAAALAVLRKPQSRA
jgi:peptide/nickel transport system substrate-binding protein